MVVHLGGNLVSWSSKKQHVVTRSSTEAEDRALARTVAEIMWIKSLLQELRAWQQNHTPTVYCDNVSTILMSANPVLHSKTKHVELDIFFVREKLQQKEFVVHHISAEEQVADILTKALSQSRFSRLKTQLQISESSSLV